MAKTFFHNHPVVTVAAAAMVAVALLIPVATPGADEPSSSETTSKADDHRQPPLSLSLGGPDLEPVRAAARETAEDAMASAAERSLGTHRLPDTSREYADILEANALDTDQSRSIGTIRDGGLENAAALELEADHYEIIDRHRSRQTHYGTDELVGAIERAARIVAETHGGAPLRVGNLGYEHGGPIPWSASHQAGRDADIAFYALDDEGTSVPTPDLIAFDDEGRAEADDLYFDVERNWTLIRSLLTDPDIVVQYMFVSIGLKILLVEHAFDIGDDPDVIDRAIDALHQPTDAPPHDDHLHLRIACSEADRLAGCVDWGPTWEWHDWHKPALFARTRKMQRAFDNPDAEVRQKALAYLHDIRSPYAPEVAIQFGLSDADDDVRDRALEILDDIPIRSEAGIWLMASVLDSGLDDDDKKRLYSALRRAHSSRAASLALNRYEDESLGEDERAWALEALAHRTKPSLIPDLIDALEQESSPRLRTLLARQLYRNAARSDGVDWSANERTDAHQDAIDQWRRWWQDKPDRSRILRDFVIRHGAEDWKDVEAIDEFVETLRTTDEDYQLYTLNVVISRWTGRWRPREWDDDDQPYRFWSNWWDRNRERIVDPAPRPWDHED